MTRAATAPGRRTGALWVPDLLLRAHLPPADLGLPAAVVEPKGVGGGRVLAVTAAARQAGVHPGHTRVAALARLEGLRLAELDPPALRAAQDRLLGALQTVSPRVEDGLAVAHPDTPLAGAGLVRFEARGMDLLHPEPTGLLDAAAAAARRAGFPGARTALADGPFCAAVLARQDGGIAPPGQGRRALAAVPLEAAVTPETPPLPEPALEQLRLLAVRTLGAFAALPAASVEARFGPEGLRLHRLAQGDDRRPLQPWSPPAPPLVHVRLETAARGLPAVLAETEVLLEALTERLRDRGLGLARLDAFFRIRGRRVARRLELTDPLAPPATVAGLLRLQLEGHPLDGPVEEIALRAGRTVPRPRGQADLFAPNGPEKGLDRALARLRGRLGQDRIGTPVLDDTHRPEAGFHLDPSPRRPTAPAAAPPGPAALALRLYPQPRAARVDVDAEGRPCRIDAHPAHSEGPFPLSGEWWAAPYDRAYYEVETDDALLWVFQDGRDGAWYVHGLFD